MSGISTRWDWFLGIATGGAYALGANYANAQIIPDGTLPTNSSVIQEAQTFNITGGTQAGSNLFHSFQEFSVPTDFTASFNNATNIQNIISRVTGGSVSDINGLIRANGTANLFLINPYGIIFGPNASLNIGGSFVATTASAIQFGNQGFFSATVPNTPELLTINPSAFFFNQIATARIENKSVSPAGIAPIGLPTTGLRVPDGRSLLLLGGNVSLDGGSIRAYGGRVELSGLASSGTVGIEVNGFNLSLGFPDHVTRADVSLTNGASVRVDAAGGGSIAVNARNLDILGGSILNAGIGPGLGSVGAVAGDITLDATGSIKVAGRSYIFNDVEAQAVGKGGNIAISAGSLSLTDGARLSTSTSGQGNAGTVKVRAIDSVSLNSARIFSTVESGAVANGGDININAATLSLTDGAQLQTSVRGASKTQPAGLREAGNVNIDVTGELLIAGVKDGLPSGIGSFLGTGAIGKGGNITITSGSLSLTDGAGLQTSTFGQGNLGSIMGAIDSVLLNYAGILSTVESGAVGKGGGININATTLSLTDGAGLLTLVREAFSTLAAGQGEAGNVNINVTGALRIAGVKDGFASGIFSTLGTGAIGKGGNITIFSDSLSLTDGARLETSTSGQGNAGTIEINATDAVRISGTSSITGKSSGLFTLTNSSSRSGDITINTSTFTVSDGAVLDARTTNDGDGGDITLSANSVEVLNGGQLLSTTNGSGNAGKIKLNATNSVIVNGTDANFNSRVAQFGTTVANVNAASGLFVRSESTGTAGDIEVSAPQIRLDNSGRFIAESESGNGGNITLNVGDLLLLRGGSLISTNAGTEETDGGDGGNITITAPNGFIVAVPNENSDITANAFEGKGGRVKIKAFGIYGIGYRSQQNPLSSDITASSTFGANGTVELNTPSIDPNSGLINLPTVPIDTQLAQGCYSPGYAQSSFIITGRGGLPPNPKEVLSPDAVLVDWVTLDPEFEKSSSTNISPIPTNTTPAPIVEATGWVYGPNGEVIFTAQSRTAQHHNSWQTATKCHEN